MLVDTHCHLTDPAFDADREAVVARMHEAGVARAIVIASDLTRLDSTIAWCASRDAFRIATGCHPHDAGTWSPELEASLVEAWRHPRVAAVGEIGLDYHYDHAPRHRQRDVFARQLALAAARDLPVAIHARDADDDVVAILRGEPRATVILHSFSSGPSLRDAGLAQGWYFSFSGMVTFKSWNHADTVRAVAPERLLVETDAPYLAPVPHRGRRNEPAHVALVARRVAEIREVTFDALVSATGDNAARLFWKPGSNVSSIGA